MNRSGQIEEEIFQQCLDLPAAKRPHFIETACAGNPDLRDSVLALLASHEKSQGFMDSPLSEESVEVKTRLERIAPSDERPGDHIGRYRLLELLGAGASGSVWMAQQTEDIDRRVALKILKLGMDTKEFLARFEAERQMLAIMDHPNVTKMLDAGATDYGRPYFVMEIVKGVPILEYCELRQLSIRERVKLCIKICHGLEHAHQKGIIHRDLKPSNILVGIQDDQPDPRIIDFGIAKTTNFRLTDKTLYTGIHTFLGTPVYSSPEQLECSSLEVDHRTDIYSFGALLYELLCGKPPFDHEELSKLCLKDLQEYIRDEEPNMPSVTYSGIPAVDQACICSSRRTNPTQLLSQLKGDLDWIVMMCLDKDPAQRYETALDLSQDLQAYLDDKPITAAAPGLKYKLKKFIQRNRPAYAIWLELSVAVLAILLVLSFVIPGTVSSGPDSTIRFVENSIAVLPLSNLSPDPENAFFADGIHEDLLTNLSHSDDLLVVARASTLPYRGTAKSPSIIANELGVGYLVMGSVRQSENRVLVTFQLIEAQSGRQQWSGYFERELTDSFAVQNSIAKEAAVQINAALPQNW